MTWIGIKNAQSLRVVQVVRERAGANLAKAVDFGDVFYFYNCIIWAHKFLAVKLLVIIADELLADK